MIWPLVIDAGVIVRKPRDDSGQSTYLASIKQRFINQTAIKRAKGDGFKFKNPVCFAGVTTIRFSIRMPQSPVW